MNKIAIWQINDMEWWIGAGTPESILADYIRISGPSHEETAGAHPERLSAEALDSLLFQDCDEDERTVGAPRTFRQQMEMEVAEGGDFPRLFACQDW